MDEDRHCTICFALVDHEGEATGECPAWGMPAQCEECGGCLCDGSC
jgi:hypothetical protein